MDGVRIDTYSYRNLDVNVTQLGDVLRIEGTQGDETFLLAEVRPLDVVVSLTDECIIERLKKLSLEVSNG